ncbi:SigB/SigF/SigG family RNA polymerase sigma factor [Streptomyces finlayi]|uniref:SigB/SigF/SigG family RNA polymerase sigma factor n=1 Tax=Streptomyces finlayi TaxID=67296 RepID=A0A7G7BNL9_9ACTN|nr:RNA polymerase sigma factor SigF [Streptomyces finlayi]QNE76934.1 SigB/SigF/SigG family RNA polymerase sigma factor [Streptomyces finlayi]
MSPRLDVARTHDVPSICPQGPTDSDPPAAIAVPGPRTSTTGTTSKTGTTSSTGMTSTADSTDGADSADASAAEYGKGLEVLEWLEDLPEIPPYAELGPVDSRALSKTLFARLESLEEGTHEYAYVRNTLVELNMALVKFAASRFRSRSEPMEDIVQVGTIGLIKAIDRFELSRGVEFPTFAMPTVIGEIKRFFRDTSWSVRVPRRLQELRLDLAKAGDELSQKLDRAPTVTELGERLGITDDEVVEGMVASNAYTASSLDAKPEENDHESALADRIGYEDHGLEGIEYVESLKPLIASLPMRDRTILSLRFVANMTQSEIGEELGISQMHVSRLLSRTLVKLRKGLTLEE